MKREGGFTLVEVMIAVLILTVGILGLTTSAALVTRMIQRGQRAAVAANFALQRMERLRGVACRSRTSGSEALMRGGRAVAANQWAWQVLGDSTHRVLLITRYISSQNRWRVDTLETEFSCRL